MKRLMLTVVLYGAVLVTTSEIVTQQYIGFNIFPSSVTIIRREERHPIEPREGAAVYNYYKDIYTVDIASDEIMFLKTITPSNYVPATSTDEVIEWAE